MHAVCLPPVCLQVSKAVMQDDYEAGAVTLAAVVQAVSGPSRGSVAVSGNVSSTTVLAQQPSMVVTIAVDAGQSTMISVAGKCILCQHDAGNVGQC